MKKSLIAFAGLILIVGCNKPGEVSKTHPTNVIVDAYSQYVLEGDTFHAQIIPLNSAEWKDQIQFENTGGPITESHWENGVLKVAIKADHLGLVGLNGNFKIKTDKGDSVLSFTSEFMVAKRVANVGSKYLIKDFDNEIYVGMAGVIPNFKLSAPNAEIKGNFGKYVITPHNVGTLVMSVKSEDGKTDYGSFEFEVFEKK